MATTMIAMKRSKMMKHKRNETNTKYKYATHEPDLSLDLSDCIDLSIQTKQTQGVITRPSITPSIGPIMSHFEISSAIRRGKMMKHTRTKTKQNKGKYGIHVISNPRPSADI